LTIQSGHLMNQIELTDIDECLVDNGGCEGQCTNKQGSYQCSCSSGFRLASNGKKCIDHNECLLRNGHGPCQGSCRNTHGGYECSCNERPGTQLASDGHSCEDLDECAGDNFGCSHTCLNTLGTAFCICPDGYMLADDWKTCEGTHRSLNIRLNYEDACNSELVALSRQMEDCTDLQSP